ncbi:MAG: Phage protein [Bradyrhizobium sp.]|nr:Phage protein [Bradyrhizobium sp.]
MADDPHEAYRLLLQCHLSGQIASSQWVEHLQDEAFATWLKSQLGPISNVRVSSATKSRPTAWRWRMNRHRPALLAGGWRYESHKPADYEEIDIEPLYGKEIVDALEAALLPFALEAERIHPDWASERRRASLTPSKELTVGDFRRAHDLLTGSQGSTTGIKRFGKKAAGRLLDGIEHNAFPEVKR